NGNTAAPGQAAMTITTNAAGVATTGENALPYPAALPGDPRGGGRTRREAAQPGGVLRRRVASGFLHTINIPRRSRGFFIDGQSPMILATRHVTLVRPDIR